MLNFLFMFNIDRSIRAEPLTHATAHTILWVLDVRHIRAVIITLL